MSDAKHQIVRRAEHGIVPARLHPLVEQAITHNPDPATLRELLQVQREWEAGEAKKAFTRALVALKRELPTVLKHDKEVDFRNREGKRTHYTHTSLAHAIEEITPALTAHGFSLTWEPARSGRDDVVVTARLTHSEGHSETCTLSAPVDTSGNKSPAQGVASTVTLLQRYTALSLLGIATAEHHEPTPADEPLDTARVDAARNLRAVGKLAKHGRTREEAEHYLGRPVREWTGEDLERLSAWVRPKHDPSTGEVSPDHEPPLRQPGED